MSHSSAARQQRRAMRNAKVVVLERVAIDSDALLAAVMSETSTTDLIAYHVAAALERLYEGGADLVSGLTVVTIGEHPNFPDGLMIEAKSSAFRPAPRESKDDDQALVPDAD